MGDVSTAEGSIADELARDLGFGSADAERLGGARALLLPHLDRVVDRFYEVIAQNPRTRAVFEDEAQIERQKAHLGGWLEGLFGGTYDEGYWRQREQIGRTHVRIELDQRYMVSMMGVVRAELERATLDAATAAGWSHDRTEALRVALDKLLDLELAVMLETYQAAFVRRARAGERLATVGQVVATIGHELRNPLAVIDSSLHLVGRRVPEDPRIRKHLDRIAGQVKVADGIITNLLAMVRDQPPSRALVDLHEAVEDAWSGVRGAEGVAFESDLTIEQARVDPAHLRQLLVNLFQNAVEAGAERLRLSVGRVEGETLEIVIEDDGTGLPEGAEDWLFEPLQSTRERGVGLGLALCRRIVQKHGGEILAERLEGGTRFRAQLRHAAPVREASS